MAAPWNLAGDPVTLGPPGVVTVTLVEGSSFAISGRGGDVYGGTAQGLFHLDTRFISNLHLLVDDEPVEPLTVIPGDPFVATFVGRARPRPGRVESTLLIERTRYVGAGMREDIVIHNHASEAAAVKVALCIDADFANLFDVKEGRAAQVRERSCTSESNALLIEQSPTETHSRFCGVRISTDQPVTVSPYSLTYDAVIEPRSEWRACVQVVPVVDGSEVAVRYRCGEKPGASGPAQRLLEWRMDSPIVLSSNESLLDVVRQSEEDLGALRIFDPVHPARAVVAAGAPWFMTLFGRDSLITSWMALLVDPSLALGTLQTLAELQGTKVDAASDEEPGRIMHERRSVGGPGAFGDGKQVYYGSVDATPLFVMLLGELRRWGLERDAVDELLPHADRALDWCVNYGDRDGDGFIEYQRQTDRGLVNQGWKDSFDGINFADGTLAKPPIALCEVQGYAYAAYIARSHFAGEAGDVDAQHHWSEQAAKLKAAFNEQFWLADRGYFAIGLDADKKPIDSLASNMGHCLWAGIVDQDKAHSVAARLMSREMFSGWGIRTLATSMGAYNPMSYHNGSVWPHDTAIVATGLMRYGFVHEAQQLAHGLVAAGRALGGRLPELLCGFAREEYAVPIVYPTSCSPQAWAAASPLLLLRTLLRFDPWVPSGKLWISPALPLEFADLRIANIPLAGARLDIRVHASRVQVDGLPDSISLVDEPRHPLTAAIG